MMVTHHRKDGHPPSKIWSPLSKRWSPIFQIIVPNDPQYGQTPSPGGSPIIQILPPTNPRNATHHHLDGHPLSKRYGCTPSPGWSANNSRIVTHHLQDCQIDLEFDSSAAKLVSFFFPYNPIFSPIFTFIFCFCFPIFIRVVTILYILTEDTK